MYIKNGTGNKNSLEDNSLAMSVVDHYMYVTLETGGLMLK